MNPADDLTARIQHIAERARQRQRERTPEPTPKPARVVRLPLWPAELRASRCVNHGLLFHDSLLASTRLPRGTAWFSPLNSPRVGSFTLMRRPQAPPGLTPSLQALLPAQLAVGS